MCVDSDQVSLQNSFIPGVYVGSVNVSSDNVNVSSEDVNVSSDDVFCDNSLSDAVDIEISD